MSLITLLRRLFGMMPTEPTPIVMREPPVPDQPQIRDRARRESAAMTDARERIERLRREVAQLELDRRRTERS